MSDTPIDVQSASDGVNYPATKADLMKTARENDGDDQTMAALAQLPDGVIGPVGRFPREVRSGRPWSPKLSI